MRATDGSAAVSFDSDQAMRRFVIDRIWFLSREGLYVIRTPLADPLAGKIDNPLTTTDSFVDAAGAPDGTCS
jgi:hypothetical protein